MDLDSMGSKERAWRCLGFTIEYDGAIRRRPIVTCDGRTCTATLPERARHDDDERDIGCGYALADLSEQLFGWLGLMVRVARAMEDAQRSEAA
jgi:hypothetical protein